MPELTLDHDERDAFVHHLDRVGVSELMRREPPPNTRRDGDMVELFPGC